MDTLEDAFDADRALVFGIGGGGDVVGAIPTARLLESRGVDALIGGIAWERSVTDPRPGPRPFSEVEGLDRVSDGVGLASDGTRTVDGVEFTETRVARHLGEPVALIDVTGGAEGVVDGLDAACESLGIDLLVGTDSGGDSLAAGDEPGLVSPLADALGLAALADVGVDAALGVFGYGSDGELSRGELDAGIGRVARRGGLLGAWGLTRRVVREMEGLLEVVDTEASRLPVEAANGDLGERRIRGGERTLDLTPASTVTFYLDPDAVIEATDLPGLVRGTADVVEADRALRDAGLETELPRAARDRPHGDYRS